MPVCLVLFTLLLKDFHSHHAIAISVQDVVMESVMSAVVNSC